jgi:hypothetical protein
MRGPWALVGFASVVALGGCTDHCIVKMRPVEGGLERRVEIWREGSSFGKDVPPVYTALDWEVRDALTIAYGSATSGGETATFLADGRFRFEGTFAQPPRDLDNFGHYEVSRTSLGSVHSYVEEFGGDPDLADTLERRLRAADLLAQFVAEWVRAEVGEARYSAVESFVEGRLRQDLRNAAEVIAEAFHTHSHPDAELRMAIFLRRNGYRVQDSGSLLVGSGLAHALQLRLASEMGVGEGETLPASLAFLDPLAVEGSLKRFVPESMTLRRLADQAAGADGEIHAGPERALDDLMADIAEARRGKRSGLRRLRVELACGVVPLSTNGVWDEEDRIVRWPWTTVLLRGRPHLVYAGWAVPDVRAQQERLGRVALRGESLAAYVGWRSALSEARGIEWDRLLDSLRGDQSDRAETVERLRPAGDEDWAWKGRAILQKGLASR